MLTRPLGEKSAISIHVPREGDDSGQMQRQHLTWISIHVPREGDDL